MISDHRFSSTRLCAYRDGALPDGEARRVHDHLARCLQCRGSLTELTAMATHLRAANAPAPDGLAERVIAYLDAESAAARLSVISSATDVVRPGRAAAAWDITRRHLRHTLPLAFVVGLLVTLLKDLGSLLAEGFTLETCAICGANFVVAFAVLNLGLLLAFPSLVADGEPPRAQ